MGVGVCVLFRVGVGLCGGIRGWVAVGGLEEFVSSYSCVLGVPGERRAS